MTYCLSAVPDPPGIPEPTDWTAHQVDLAWKEPFTDGGSPITGYIIEKKDKYSTLWEKALETNTPKPEALITGLIEGNEYQFRVIAINKAGQSEPGECSKTFLAKPRFCKCYLHNVTRYHLLYSNIIKTNMYNYKNMLRFKKN